MLQNISYLDINKEQYRKIQMQNAYNLTLVIKKINLQPASQSSLIKNKKICAKPTTCELCFFARSSEGLNQLFMLS